MGLKARPLYPNRYCHKRSAWEAIDLVLRCGVTPTTQNPSDLAIDSATLGSKEGQKGFIRDRDFFKLLGATELIALDHSDYEGAEIIWNLNIPIPERLEGVADFILDGSTIDNVFDTACTLRNMNRLLRPGGRIVSTNMGSNHYAPYTLPTPQWIFNRRSV
jgi:SAM-dependent methyltransferase